MTNAWLPGSPAATSARARLFCFPYAGGGATLYRPWIGAAPPELQICRVQLPGREGRVAEEPFRRTQPLIAALTEAVRAHLDRPFAFFGHSMGALVAFELARALRRAGLPQPRHLFLSAHRAPHLPDRGRPLHSLPEAELWAELRELEGTPEELFAHAELMELMLPLLRADFELCETYEHQPEQPLEIPFTIFGATEDSTVDTAELAAWRDHTHAPVRQRTFRGHHLYLQHAHAEVLAAVVRELSPLLVHKPS